MTDQGPSPFGAPGAPDAPSPQPQVAPQGWSPPPAQSAPPVGAYPSPGNGVPPVYAPTGYPAPAAAPSVPPKRSRAWMWWTLGMLLAVAAVVGSCAFIVWVADTGATGAATTFGDTVAVIHIDGVIAGTGSTFDGIISPEYFKSQLDQAADDPNVKALVLRVDSPGGTVAASQEIAAYVKEFKRSKPVVVSVGDVDASGAYMVSCQANTIIANPGSAVGSIGVITEIPNVAGLLDKVGVEFQVITAGKYKDAGSPYRPLTDEEKALIQGQIDQIYGQFIDTVAEGRKMERSEVESLATGWAWNGEEAKKLGLVDEIGTYEDALDKAADLGKIEGDYEVINYDEYAPEDLFLSLLGVQRRLDPAEALRPSMRESLPR